MTGQHERHNRRRGGRFVPGVESLEERWLPTVHFFALGGVLFVGGDNAGDRITIFDNGSSGVNNVLATAGRGTFIPGSAISRVQVKTGLGNDRVTYNLLGSLGTNVGRTVAVSLGAGNNTFVANVAGNLSTGSALALQVAGGPSADNFVVNVANDISIGARATLSVALIGGDGPDAMTVNYRGQDTGTVAVFTEGDAGADVINTQIVLNAGSNGAVSAQELGGAGNDTFTLNEQKVNLFDGAAINAVIDGGQGINTAFASPAVTTTRTQFKFPV